MPLERIVQMGLGVGRTKLFYCVAWKMAHQVMAIGRITADLCQTRYCAVKKPKAGCCAVKKTVSEEDGSSTRINAAIPMHDMDLVIERLIKLLKPGGDFVYDWEAAAC